MDRGYVVEHDLVDRYLRGALSQQESEAFEAFFLDDQETLEELELMAAVRLEVGARRVEKTTEDPDFATGLPRTDTPASAAIPGRWHAGSRRWSLPITAAASLAAGVLIGTLLLNNGPSAAPAGSMRLVEVATLRSDDRIEVSVPRNVGYAAFRVAIGAQPSAVDLFLNRGGEPITVIEGLVTDAYGDVTFVVPASQLEPGIYEIRAISTVSGETVFVNQITLSRAWKRGE